MSFDCKVEYIKELLSVIPRHVEYNNYLAVNAAVLNELGPCGKELLIAHWDTEDVSKLSDELDYQMSSLSGDLTQLGVVARECGYKSKAGRKYSTHKAKKRKTCFQEPLSVEMATSHLNRVIKKFFDSKKNSVVGISTGSGKSRCMIQIVARLADDVKVLILLPDHELAEQTAMALRKELEGGIDPYSFRRVKHIKGKNLVCENDDIRSRFNKAGIGIPYSVCHKVCPHQAITSIQSSLMSARVFG